MPPLSLVNYCLSSSEMLSPAWVRDSCACQLKIIVDTIAPKTYELCSLAILTPLESRQPPTRRPDNALPNKLTQYLDLRPH